MAARSAPRWEPANVQLRLSFGGVVAEADPAVVDEAGEVDPAPEHVVHRLKDLGRARERIALAEQPGVHVVEKWFALLLAHGIPLVSAASVDRALDLEQLIQAPDRLQRDRGDRLALLALAGILLDVGQFEEAPPRMGEARHLTTDRTAAPRLPWPDQEPGASSPPGKLISRETAARIDHLDPMGQFFAPAPQHQILIASAGARREAGDKIPAAPSLIRRSQIPQEGGRLPSARKFIQALAISSKSIPAPSRSDVVLKSTMSSQSTS